MKVQLDQALQEKDLAVQQQARAEEALTEANRLKNEAVCDGETAVREKEHATRQQIQAIRERDLTVLELKEALEEVNLMEHLRDEAVSDRDDIFERLRKTCVNLRVWKQEKQADIEAEHLQRYNSMVDELEQSIPARLKEHVDAGGCPNCPVHKDQLEDRESLLSKSRDAHDVAVAAQQALSTELKQVQGERGSLQSLLDDVQKKHQDVQDQLTTAERDHQHALEQLEVESEKRAIDKLRPRMRDEFDTKLAVRSDENKLEYNARIQQLEAKHAEAVARIKESCDQTNQDTGDFVRELAVLQTKAVVDTLCSHHGTAISKIAAQLVVATGEIQRLKHVEQQEQVPETNANPVEVEKPQMIDAETQTPDQILHKRRSEFEEPSPKRIRLGQIEGEQNAEQVDSSDLVTRAIQDERTDEQVEADPLHELHRESEHGDDSNGPETRRDSQDESKYDRVKNMFLLAFDATTQEELDFHNDLFSILQGKNSVEAFCEHVDEYCRGPVHKPGPDPGPCFFAKMSRSTAGSGGPNMTQKSCPRCSPNRKPKKTCFFVQFAPGVHSGYSPRVNGKIESARYDASLGPRTVLLAGLNVRWIVKKRKASQQDPANPLWEVEGHHL